MLEPGIPVNGKPTRGEPARFRVVIRSTVTGRTLKVLARDMSMDEAYLYVAGYGGTGSWKTVASVQRDDGTPQYRTDA